MTQHEQTIRDYCRQHAIRINTYAGGVLRLVGPGVDITVSDVASVTISNLAEYQPRKGRAVRGEWPVLEYK
jgi:hypothetical protein